MFPQGSMLERGVSEWRGGEKTVGTSGRGTALPRT